MNLKRNTTKPDAFAVWKARQAGNEEEFFLALKSANRRTIIDRRAGEHAQQLRPKRSFAQEQRAFARRMKRKTFQPDSMLNMGAPARHVPLPRFPSERERALFNAHEKRKASGWVHG